MMIYRKIFIVKIQKILFLVSEQQPLKKYFTETIFTYEKIKEWLTIHTIGHYN